MKGKHNLTSHETADTFYMTPKQRKEFDKNVRRYTRQFTKLKKAFAVVGIITLIYAFAALLICLIGGKSFFGLFPTSVENVIKLIIAVPLLMWSGLFFAEIICNLKHKNYLFSFIYAALTSVSSSLAVTFGFGWLPEDSTAAKVAGGVASVVSIVIGIIGIAPLIKTMFFSRDDD